MPFSSRSEVCVLDAGGAELVRHGQDECLPIGVAVAAVTEYARTRLPDPFSPAPTRS